MRTTAHSPLSWIAAALALLIWGVGTASAQASTSGPCVAPGHTTPATIGDATASAAGAEEAACGTEAPTEVRRARPGSLWATTDGQSTRVISRGDEVHLDSWVEVEGFTVVHFGAQWCAACHLAERSLRAYLGEREDVAVRAIVLDGRTPRESYALPAAVQHRARVAMLPHLAVFDASGEEIYTGYDVSEALATIERAR